MQSNIHREVTDSVANRSAAVSVSRSVNIELAGSRTVQPDGRQLGSALRMSRLATFRQFSPLLDSIKNHLTITFVVVTLSSAADAER